MRKDKNRPKNPRQENIKTVTIKHFSFNKTKRIHQFINGQHRPSKEYHIKLSSSTRYMTNKYKRRKFHDSVTEKTKKTKFQEKKTFTHLQLQCP